LTWPWQRSIGARIVLIVVGLLSVVLLLVNLVMARLLLASELEEAANHLQIQALMAAQALQDPLSGYSRELGKLESRDHDDHDEHDHEDSEESKPGEAARWPERPEALAASLLPVWAESYARDSGMEVLVADLQGGTLAGEGPRPTAEELKRAGEGRPLHRLTESTIYATAPLSVRAGVTAGLVRLGQPRAAAVSRSHALIASLALASATALLLAFLAAAGLSRRLLRPLHELEQSARQAAQGDWRRPVALDGQDELASLSRAFAAMLSELEAMLERQRLFISHASHELRTPLTRMKLRTEALADGAIHDPAVAERFVQELDGEVDRLARLATILLDLGRLDHGLSGPSTPDPLSVLKAVVERSRLPALERGVQLVTGWPPALPPLPLSPDTLDSVLANLLDNAIAHTAEGGTISVNVENEEQQVGIVVADSGIGISSDHLPHIFERFYRADPSRTSGGAGLGLSLVKAAVEAAAGEISVSSTPGQGTTFSVKLPVVAASG
jgi:signal transduction histidine kinase